MRWILVFLIMFSLSGLANAQTLTVTGETEFFNFTVEFKDSLLVNDFSDSVELVKEQVEIALNMVFSECMIPDFYKQQTDLDHRHVIVRKIQILEKRINLIPAGDRDEKKLLKAREALAINWHKLYAMYRFDWIDIKYQKPK